MVLDAASGVVHRLDSSASLVFHTVSKPIEFDELTNTVTGASNQITPELVAEIVDDLANLGLVDSHSKYSWNRREAMVAGAVVLGGAVASPFIQTLVLPSVAAAASGGSGGGGGGGGGGVPALINPHFTEGTDGWTATDGFQTHSGNEGNRPSVHDNALIFSHDDDVNVVRQTLALGSVTAFNQITSTMNIRNNQSIQNTSLYDTYYFEVVFRDSANTVLTSLRTPTSGTANAPDTATDVVLTLTRSGFAGFDSIASVEVIAFGDDVGYWAGNYGPIVEYITVVPS